MAEIDEFINRRPPNVKESAVGRVSIAEIEDKKLHDMILTIQRSLDSKETIRCEAWPAF